MTKGKWSLVCVVVGGLGWSDVVSKRTTRALSVETQEEASTNNASVLNRVSLVHHLVSSQKPYSLFQTHHHRV